MIEELRKYRALVVALSVTLVAAVALFVHFLRADLERAERSFAVDVARAAAKGEERLERLLDRTGVLGHAYLRLGITQGQLLGMIDASDLDATLDTVCAREDGAPRVIHAGAEVAATVLAAERCAEDFVPQRRLAPDDDGGALVIDARLVPPTPGGAPTALELRMRGEGARELRATLSAAALFETLAPGVLETKVPVTATCLALLVGETFRPLACRGDEAVAADPPAAIAGDALGHAEEIETAGLRWRLSAVPHYRALAHDLTPLPFYVLGATLALGALVCAFAYVTATQNLRLESDATELQRLLGRLERQHAELDQFAVMAAHDLQAPLRFVVANTHLLVMELDGLERPDLSRIGTTLVEQGERMRALVLDLLEFCRAGQTELEIAATDVGALVEEEIRLLRTAEEHFRTHISVGSLPCALPCDASKLAQVVRNLLGNAVKFSRQGPSPRVSISAGRDGRDGPWTFRVEDNGPGIDEAHRERIFLPFNRLDRTTEGTGIGLAIVKKLVERHGGRIWLDPKFTDGSAFCFTLPCTVQTEKS